MTNRYFLVVRSRPLHLQHHVIHAHVVELLQNDYRNLRSTQHYLLHCFLPYLDGPLGIMSHLVRDECEALRHVRVLVARNEDTL